VITRQADGVKDLALELNAAAAAKDKRGGERRGKNRGAAGAGYVSDVPQDSPRSPETPGFPYILEGFPTFL
jgi:hypothetical protein